MWDDDLMNFLNGTTTTTDTSSENSESNFSAGQTQETYSPYETQQNQTSYSPYSNQSYSSDYDDDYSVTPNYQEETNYNNVNQTTAPAVSQTTTQEVRYRKMAIPTIEKKQKAVSLTKMKERIYLGARMKIVISVFAIIMFSLAFVSIWNFVSVSKLNSEIAEKQLIVNELTTSISGLQSEYNLLSDGDNLLQMAEDAGFVYSDETNTYHVSAGTFYEEASVEELPSNWFNEVCEFLSNLFH